MTLLRGAVVRFQGGLCYGRLVGGAVDGHARDLLPRRRDEDLLGAGGPGLLRGQKQTLCSQPGRGLNSAGPTRAGVLGRAETE